MKRPNKKEYDLNCHFETLRFAKDMMMYADYLEKPLEDKIILATHEQAVRYLQIPTPKPIDSVTVGKLQFVLNICDLKISEEFADKIIDIFELLEDNPEGLSLFDINKLKQEWRDHGYK